ncbi:MAG: tetratricopeptide repeat protein [Acidiferrobacterales bacterium]
MQRFCLTIVMLTWTTWVFPDQTDARLNALFEQLQATEDTHEGAEITQEIWNIWRRTNNQVADELMAQGVREMALERYEKALAALDKVVTAAPEYAEGWNTRATLLYLMGDFVASAVDVKRTLALEPRHFGAWSGLGLIYMHLGDDQAALGAFQRALEWNPHLIGPRQHLDVLKQRLKEKII